MQNITDVGHLQDDAGIDDAGEDKLLAQAKLEDRSPFAVARFYEEAFHRDLAALNVHPADAYPRASECIDLMITLIAGLVEQGHAYVGDDGTVYFDARSPSTRTARSAATSSTSCARGTARPASRRRPASGSTPTGRCGSGPRSRAR